MPLYSKDTRTFSKFPFLFCLHGAGHGGSVKDTSGDEADNMDETLVPVDYQSSGQITDDVILKEVHQVIITPTYS